MIFCRSSGRPQPNGFSLIELMIVIAIIGTLVGIASISYRNLRDRYSSEKQIKELFGDLMNARVRAMQRNRMHFVVIGTGQYSIYEDTDPAPDGDLSLNVALDARILSKTMDPAYPFSAPATWTASGATAFRFDKKGIVPSEVLKGGDADTVRISSAASGEYDCIEMSEIKITLGKWNGTSCVAQ